MKNILTIFNRIISYWLSVCAIDNFSNLNDRAKIEGVKLIIGQAAGLATASQTAGLPFFQEKVAGVPSDILPTSPVSLFINHLKQVMSTWTDSTDALAGDARAAQQSVGRARNLGRGMAGFGDRY